MATPEKLMAGGDSGPVIQPGKAAESLLVRHIKGEEQPRMPNGRRPLTDATIDKCSHIVGLLGPEPYVEAVKAGADIGSSSVACVSVDSASSSWPCPARRRPSATYERALALLADAKFAAARTELHALAQAANGPHGQAGQAAQLPVTHPAGGPARQQGPAVVAAARQHDAAGDEFDFG